MSEGDLKKAFQIFDENGDGFISPEELEHMVNILSGVKMGKEEVHELIRVADTNGDGKIDYKEFAVMMSNLI